MNSIASSDLTEATVISVRNGPRGKFAIARTVEKGRSVTFSLEISVWQEDDPPVLQEIVQLSMLRKFKGGWRALRAQRPSIT